GQQGAKAVDGIGRRAEASSQGKSPNRAGNRGGVREDRTGRPTMILDTNALSAFAEGMPPVVQHIASADELHVPAIVLGEYRFGITTSRRRREYAAWLARGSEFWCVV